MRLVIGVLALLTGILLPLTPAAAGGPFPNDGDASTSGNGIDFGADDPGDPSSWQKSASPKTGEPARKGGSKTSVVASRTPACTDIDSVGCAFQGIGGGGGPETSPPPPPNPADMGQQAVGRLSLPVPLARTSPEAPVETLVGLQTWLWVAPEQWRPLTASVTAGSTTVSATVRPTGTRWNMGEGATSCAGPGRPWRRGLGQVAKTSCGYTYETSSASEPGDRFRISVSVTYSASWTCTGACTSAGGDLGSLQSPASTAQLEVAEREPVVIR